MARDGGLRAEGVRGKGGNRSIFPEAYVSPNAKFVSSHPPACKLTQMRMKGVGGFPAYLRDPEQRSCFVNCPWVEDGSQVMTPLKQRQTELPCKTSSGPARTAAQ